MAFDALQRKHLHACFKVNICLTSIPGFWGWSLDSCASQNCPRILICSAENIGYEYVSESSTGLGFKRCSTTYYPGARLLHLRWQLSLELQRGSNAPMRSGDAHYHWHWWRGRAFCSPQAAAQLRTASRVPLRSSASRPYASVSCRARGQSLATRASSKASVSTSRATGECRPRRTVERLAWPQRLAAWLCSCLEDPRRGSQAARREASSIGNCSRRCSHSRATCSAVRGTSLRPRSSFHDKLGLVTFVPREAPRQATVASSFERDLRKAKVEEVRAEGDESLGEERGFFSDVGFSVGFGELCVESGTSSRQWEACSWATVTRWVRRDDVCWLCREEHRARGSQQQLTMTCGTLRLSPSWARRAASLVGEKQRECED